MLYEEDGARFVATLHPVIGGFRAGYNLQANAGGRFEETPAVHRVEPTEAKARAWLHAEAHRRGFKTISWEIDE